MTYTELAELRAWVDQLLEQKKAEAKTELRQKITQMAKAQGMNVEDVLGRRMGAREKGKGSVPIKYRDPNNPANAWSGRGRTPRWMVAAMKGSKAKKENFLI